MIRYVNQGERNFANFPTPPNPRNAWEFLLVESGDMSVKLPKEDNRTAHFTSGELLLAGPRNWHKWLVGRKNLCRIRVIHFTQVPSEIEKWLGLDGFVHVKLLAKEIDRFQELHEAMTDQWRRPQILSPMYTHHALLEFSLMILRKAPTTLFPLPKKSNRQRVDAALWWFQNHLEEKPDHTKVSRAMGISPTHLRRLFHQCQAGAPNQAYQKARMERAQELLLASTAPIEQIAELCGFSSASAFCRAFKTLFHASPSLWRSKA